jgi:hypothetical protein
LQAKRLNQERKHQRKETDEMQEKCKKLGRNCAKLRLYTSSLLSPRDIFSGGCFKELLSTLNTSICTLAQTRKVLQLKKKNAIFN